MKKENINKLQEYLESKPNADEFTTVADPLETPDTPVIIEPKSGKRLDDHSIEELVASLEIREGIEVHTIPENYDTIRRIQVSGPAKILVIPG